jgi:nitrogen-specific signal transduction histidine kinase
MQILQTDFDESIGKINVVPQDIGRVVLNLFNNAFYALSAKRLTSPRFRQINQRRRTAIINQLFPFVQKK